MSKFSEYLTMVNNGLKNLPNVVEGNINFYKDLFGALSQEQKNEAERRYAICKDCPFMSINAKASGFYPTERTDEHCSVCKCPIEKKVMSFNEQCGLSYITEMKDVAGNSVMGGWVPLWGVYKTEEK